MDVAILGAGSQGRFVLDMLKELSHFRVVGFFDDGYPSVSPIQGCEVMGRIAAIHDSKVKHLVLGMGEPKVRRRLYEEFREAGKSFPAIVHPRSYVSSSAVLRDGVTIGPFATVLEGSVVGKGACLLSHVNVNQDVRLGSFSLVAAGAIIGNCAEVGDGCHIGMGARVPRKGVIAPWSDFQD